MVVAEKKLTIFFNKDGVVEKWEIEKPSKQN